jgi:malonate transporter and related proteins
MTAILLGSLAPIFGVGAFGYRAGRVCDIDNRHVARLNALLMDFALIASSVLRAVTPSARLVMTGAG